MKLLYSLGLTVCYVVVLLCIYLIHAWYFPVGVVFYAALLDAAIAAVIMGAVLHALRVPLSNFEKFLLIAIWLLGGYAFAISVPTVLDRSLSFYILEKLQQRGGGIEEAHIPDVFINEYMPEYRLVDVRLTEQQESGTIVIKHGCVELTDFGRWVATVSSYLRRHFLPKHRRVADKYTDELTQPFKSSPTGKRGYECGG